jgi:hypothetical protein
MEFGRILEPDRLGRRNLRCLICELGIGGGKAMGTINDARFSPAGVGGYVPALRRRLDKQCPDLCTEFTILLKGVSYRFDCG